MKRKREEEGGEEEHEDDGEDSGEDGEEDEHEDGEEEDGESDEEVDDFSAKLGQCFDEEGFNVVVVAAHATSSPQAIDATAPPSKVRRVDGKREYNIWSTLLCVWSTVFREMLGSGDGPATRRIEIDDVLEDSVDACLQFLYTGRLHLKVDKKTTQYCDLLLEVVKFADKYAISELKEAAKEKLSWLPTSMVTVPQLLSAGFSLSELKDMDFTIAELRSAGFSAANLKALRVTAGALRKGGYTAEELLLAGYSVNALVASFFTKSQLIPAGTTEISTDDLKAKGFSAPELRRAGLSTTYLKSAGFTASDLELAGFTLKEVVSGGFAISELKAKHTIVQLKEAGATSRELKIGGFAASELKAAMFSVAELVKAEYTSEELAAAGISAADVSAAGSQLALEMYQDRIKGLQSVLEKGRPRPDDLVFSGAVHSDPSVQAFLRSSEKKMDLKCGGGIAKARCYAEFLNQGSPVFPVLDSAKSTCTCAKNPNPTYSVTAEADGVGQGAVVNITKTTEFQILAGKQYDAKELELEKLRTEYQRLQDETDAAAKKDTV
eukprot:TRINITY_DN78004_c0_g1_i1.p1 TRINITY_DN78004_c0_g1~~TRINITY_DN78004_c0_g1_i1.p1  ORF type:complete len:551 (-),score=119.32 TRINITY_DN78004_c0_g1_i1:145-1797(-)